MLIEITILIILLVLSGVFSGLETAFTSLSFAHVQKLKESYPLRSAIVEKLKDDQHALITTLLIGNNVVNLSASALVTYITLISFSSHLVGVMTGVLTLLILVFGEVTPKKLALDHNEKICINAARFLQILVFVLTPLRWIVDAASFAVMKLFGAKQPRPKVTEEDILGAVSVGEEIGQLEPHEKRMIHNIFRFNDQQVVDVMTHRSDVFIVPETARLSEIVPELLKKGYSRIPVYKESPDSITGVIFIRDILPFLQKNELDIPVKKIMVKPFFVPLTLHVDDLFFDMKKKKTHIAIVVDEKGSFEGIVTIEDLVEEIVGEIYDEKDKVIKQIVQLNKNTYLIEGNTSLEKINKQLDLHLKGHKHYDTLAGYIMHALGAVAEQGSKIEVESGIFIVEKIHANRIQTVKLIKK